MNPVRSRARAALLLAGLLLPAGIPGFLGVHVCPNHGHGSERAISAEGTGTSAAEAPAGHGHHAPAPEAGQHGAHPAPATPATSQGDAPSEEASCDGLCELLCLSAAQLADPRTFRSATTIDLGPADVVVAFRPHRVAPLRATQLPFVLPLSHAPPSA